MAAWKGCVVNESRWLSRSPEGVEIELTERGEVAVRAQETVVVGREDVHESVQAGLDVERSFTSFRMTFMVLGLSPLILQAKHH